MPKTCCCVPHCHNRGGHKFPTDKSRREKWIQAIKRIDSTNKNKWQPTKYSVVCHDHFVQADYAPNYDPQSSVKRLTTSAVPSVFTWSKPPTPQQLARSQRSAKRDEMERLVRFSSSASDDAIPSTDVEAMVCDEDELEIGAEEVVEAVAEEIVDAVDGSFAPTESTPHKVDNTTQTPVRSMFDIENFCKDDAGVHFYTGLESYATFMFVLSTLGLAAYNLIYTGYKVVGISVPNQFFIVMIKLRRHTTNVELARMFSTSEKTVANIITTWIVFMYKQWREVSIWPSRKLISYFVPSDFKLKFPTTRVIVDGTECPIKKPRAPKSQQVSFSSYKNRNTVKLLVGSSPGGLISFITNAYGGSASDRQIVERSGLRALTEPGDSIMADKGFNVQDMFVSRNVIINMPTFFSKKNRMTGTVVLHDRKISSKRVHIERIIGLAKTFRILIEPMNSTETKLGTEITYICFMLCNFRTCIVPKYA